MFSAAHKAQDEGLNIKRMRGTSVPHSHLKHTTPLPEALSTVQINQTAVHTAHRSHYIREKVCHSQVFKSILTHITFHSLAHLPDGVLTFRSAPLRRTESLLHRSRLYFTVHRTTHSTTKLPQFPSLL